MKSKYDVLGTDYATKRKSDPRIQHQIFEKLKNADKILNIGAGTGSYEPIDKNLVAIEPSMEMIKQRSADAHPVIQGSAESLPFPDNSFSHGLTILSMHHWTDRITAFKEINRVVTDQFIAVTWNPESKPFWLTKDYFPEIYDIDKVIFPSISQMESHFESISVEPLLIPEDCIDGFLAAYWKRPEMYLDANVRHSISSFSKLPSLLNGLKKLTSDLENGNWHKQNEKLLTKSQLDMGYVIINCKIRK